MTVRQGASGGGLVMHPADGATWVFDPGALCLEFLLTGGPGLLARYEQLHRPADLAGWLALSRLRLPADQVITSGDDLDDARILRDTLWRLARCWAGSTGEDAQDTGDLAVLNRLAARPDLAPRIALGPVPDGWVLPARASQALSSIARDAISLRAGPFAGRVRECGAEDCYLIFVDSSRPGLRRWCSMQRRGNRQKVRTHRARRPLDPTPD